MEKILVLMATYNGEKFLQEQLDSLYGQEDVEVDILVRDDGSTDSTQKILEDNSQNHRLKWYQGDHKNVQKGFFELMKIGAEKNYNFFAFCDQDDVWDKDKLIIALNSIKEMQGPALYYSGQRLVDENLKFIENHELNSNRTLKTRFVLSDFAGCTGVFNKALIDEVVKFEPKYMLMHDTWVLRVCIALGGTVVVDPKPIMNYRQHSSNTLGLGHSFRATVRQVRQYIYDYHVEEVTKELVRGYENQIVPEYKEVCRWICKYRENTKYKKKLLDSNNVDFCKRGLNITYWLKVKMNRL